MTKELSNPLVVGVAARPVATNQAADKMLKQLGNNTGNLLFTEAARSLFSTPATAGYAGIDANSLEGCDSIVISAANWVNPVADFDHLVKQLENVDVPIIVLGLGAQAGLDGKIPKVKAGTQRFLSMLADKGAFISARGPFSCEVLAHYGVKNAAATGCPSLLMLKREAPSFNKPSPWYDVTNSDIVIHGTRHHFHQATGTSAHLYPYALENGHDLLLQSELADFYFAMGRTNNAEVSEKAISVLRQVYAPHVGPDIRAYLAEHGKVFFDLATWLEYCSTKKFVLGTRIHGTISGILAKTPSLLIAHDSRTTELAELMNIPFVMDKDVDLTRASQLQDLYEQTLDHDFSDRHAQYLSGFEEFFKMSNLKVNL